MSERVGIYPGSFDPPTLGHLDLIERAARVFDKVFIAVARNTEKNSLFSADERIQMLTEITSHLDNVEAIQFTGLVVDLARQRGAIAFIRGIRAVSDFEYELTMAGTNRRMNPNCDTISFMPSEEYMFVSSRLIKEIAQLGGDVSQFVSPVVDKRLKEKLKSKG